MRRLASTGIGSGIARRSARANTPHDVHHDQTERPHDRGREKQDGQHVAERKADPGARLVISQAGGEHDPADSDED